MHSTIPTHIHEELAWIHRDASTLQGDDLVELKYSLLNLIDKSTELLEMVRSALHEQRRGNMGADVHGQAIAFQRKQQKATI